MSKHTPGDWIVKEWIEYDKDGAIESCGHQVVARNGADEVGIFTTAIEGEELHDLNLIAAAPALLEALQGAIQRCESAAGGYVGMDGQFIKTMRAAVAKALGTSPEGKVSE